MIMIIMTMVINNDNDDDNNRNSNKNNDNIIVSDNNYKYNVELRGYTEQSKNYIQDKELDGKPYYRYHGVIFMCWRIYTCIDVYFCH